jgi:hypothetical protein
MTRTKTSSGGDRQGVTHWGVPARGALLLLGLLAGAGLLHGQETASWIGSTDRRANPLVEEILLFSPTEDRLAAARALGLRSDPYVSDLIGSLLGRMRGSRRFEDALVLRVLLDSVFDRSLVAEELRARAAQNPGGLDLLADGLPGFDAPLARESYRVLGLAGGKRFTGVLMSEGRALADALRRRGGRSDAEQADRLMAYLEAVEATGDETLADPVVAILQLTRTREVGRYARRVLARVLPGEN